MKFIKAQFLIIQFRSVVLLTSVFCLSTVLLTSRVQAQMKSSGEQKINLPNGWALTPAGMQIMVGDLPLNIAVTPDLKYAAVTNNGEGKQSIQLISIQDQKLLDMHEVRKSWLGLAFSDDGKSLYASGGNDNWILHFLIQKKNWCAQTP